MYGLRRRIALPRFTFHVSRFTFDTRTTLIILSPTVPRRVRLSARTGPSQGLKTGSTPVRATNLSS